MLTLSFARQYYTLWDVSSRIQYGRGEVINGVFNGESYLVTNYCYLQNLSFTKEAAIEKITGMAGGKDNWMEDESLIGHSRSWEARKKIERNFAPWQFTFGMFIGSDIRICEDVWQIRRAYYKEPGARTRATARRRLIELGEFVRYKFTDRVFKQPLCDRWWKEEASKYPDPHSVATHDMFCVDVIKNYTTPKHATMLQQRKQEAAMSGHFFEDKKRITINIKRVGGFSFETQYGTTSVEKYVTEDGRMVKYMGGNPPEISEEDFITVTGTVKHDEYKGVKETKLQRMKVIGVAAIRTPEVAADSYTNIFDSLKS